MGKLDIGYSMVGSVPTVWMEPGNPGHRYSAFRSSNYGKSCEGTMHKHRQSRDHVDRSDRPLIDPNLIYPNLIDPDRFDPARSDPDRSDPIHDLNI